MKNRINYMIFIILVFSLYAGSVGQDLIEIEGHFHEVSVQSEKEKTILDSLNNLLEEENVNMIELEKGRGQPEEDRIRRLLAESVVISNTIEQQQQKIDSITGRLNNIRTDLIEHLEQEIDALRNSITRDIKEESRTAVEGRIFNLLERKLSVAPRIPSLSFHPDKLRELDANSLRDSLHRAIYLEYLRRAKTEIKQKMGAVKNDLEEIEEVILLEEKAVDFLDEMDMLSVYSPLGAASSQAKSMDSNPSETFGELRTDRILPRIPGYINLLNQLQAEGTEEVGYSHISPSDSTRLYVTYSQYRALLEELMARLSEYNMLLEKKLSSTN